jgi:putative rhs element vgr protein
MEKSGDLLGESIVIKFYQYGKVVQTYKGVITKIENYKEEGGGYGELRISGKSPTPFRKWERLPDLYRKRPYRNY